MAQQPCHPVAPWSGLQAGAHGAGAGEEGEPLEGAGLGGEGQVGLGWEWAGVDTVGLARVLGMGLPGCPRPPPCRLPRRVSQPQPSPSTQVWLPRQLGARLLAPACSSFGSNSLGPPWGTSRGASSPSPLPCLEDPRPQHPPPHPQCHSPRAWSAKRLWKRVPCKSVWEPLPAESQRCWRCGPCPEHLGTLGISHIITLLSSLFFLLLLSFPCFLLPPPHSLSSPSFPPLFLLLPFSPFSFSSFPSPTFS